MQLNELNEKLLKARKERGISQETLAEKLGVSRQAVSKWETGEARPDIDKLAALCTELDLSMDWLCLDRQPEAEPAPAPAGKRPILPLLLAALAVFALGMLAGRGLFPIRQVEQVVETVVPALRVNDIDLVDVQIQWDWEATDRRCWTVSVMPGNPVEGLQVRFMVENDVGGIANGSSVWKAEENGAYYTARCPSQDYGSQSFTAELELNGEKRRIPLLRIEGNDDNSYSTVWLWEK